MHRFHCRDSVRVNKVSRLILQLVEQRTEPWYGTVGVLKLSSHFRYIFITTRHSNVVGMEPNSLLNRLNHAVSDKLKVEFHTACQISESHICILQLL